MAEPTPAAEPVSKKRKADAEPAQAAKKTKTDDSAPEALSVFVGGLSWNVDNDFLKSEFESVGEVVSARVVTDRATGKSKGYVASCACLLQTHAIGQIRLRRFR